MALYNKKNYINELRIQYARVIICQPVGGWFYDWYIFRGIYTHYYN